LVLWPHHLPATAAIRLAGQVGSGQLPGRRPPAPFPYQQKRNQMNRLDGKVAIVTGCARGIGKAVAELFAQEGATVVATSRSVECGMRGGTDFRRLDVADERQWIDTVSAVVEKYGHVDVLVNNAGIIAYETLHELTTSEWNAVIATNQTGVWIGMR